MDAMAVRRRFVNVMTIRIVRIIFSVRIILASCICPVLVTVPKERCLGNHGMRKIISHILDINESFRDSYGMTKKQRSSS